MFFPWLSSPHFELHWGHTHGWWFLYHKVVILLLLFLLLFIKVLQLECTMFSSQKKLRFMILFYSGEWTSRSNFVSPSAAFLLLLLFYVQPFNVSFHCGELRWRFWVVLQRHLAKKSISRACFGRPSVNTGSFAKSYKTSEYKLSPCH